MRLLKEIFQLYYNLSGQSVNWVKSEVFFGKGVTASRRSSLSRIVDIRVGSLPFNYLGVPLFVGAPRLKFLKPICDRIIAKFSTWKGKSLSMAGRLELINSVIGGSCLHCFAIYKWPRDLIENLNRCMRNFLWNGSIDERKLVTVSWSLCCKSKKSGGLGIKNLAHMNSAMLGRLSWSLISKTFPFEGPRHRFLMASGLPKTSSLSSSVWSSIKSIFSSILPDCVWHIGPQSKLSFWYDAWISPPLAHRMNLPLDSGVLASESVQLHRDGEQWAHLSQLPPAIQRDVQLIRGGLEAEDVCFWKGHVSGEFTVKTFYISLQDHSILDRFYSLIWQLFIPPSRSVLCWKVLKKRIATHDVLRRRGWMIVSRCYLCKNGVEDIDHIFWNCIFARELWRALSSIFVFSIDGIDSVKALFIKSLNTNFSPQIRDLWKVGIVSVVWLLWHTRNKACFDGAEPSIRLMLRQLWGYIRESNLSITSTVHNRWSDYSLLRQLQMDVRPPKAPRLIEVIWQPPSHGWIKANTDGAALGSPGLAGGGGVFRTSRGFPLGSFAFNSPNSFAFIVELKSAIKAVSIAWDRGWKKLWLEVDSIYVVNLFRTRCNQVPLEVRHDWINCLRLVSKMNFMISHIFREGNQVADALSKHGLQLDGFEWWPSTPNFCAYFISNDICNRPNYRFV